MEKTANNQQSKQEKVKESVNALLNQLEDGIKEMFESDGYKEYLNVMSRFHNYSCNNLMLIYMQYPQATNIAGYESWKRSFNRHVKKGEKAIKIIAPEFVKKEIETVRKDSAGNKLYENAQSKMEELKSILAEQYYNSAKDKYEGQAYSTALTDINKAISYNSDEKYQELKEKCQQGESEAKAAKAEEDRQKKLLTPGKEINTSRFNIEYVGAEFTSKILPERTSSAYSYWNCPNDSIYVDLKFYVTNTSDYSANIDFVKNFSASYGTKKYSGSSEGYCELGSNSLDTIFSSTNITPLKKVAYHIAVKLPYEVINTNDSITITFKIDGEEQLLEFR